MEPLSRENELMEKLQANLFLGLGSNFFSMAGVLGAWVFLEKTEWFSDFWSTVFTALFLFPVFMGDAMNAYFFGRVKLDTEKGWRDVYITDEGRRHVFRYYYLWRGLSMATAATLALAILSTFSPDPAAWKWLTRLLPGLFLAHYLRCQHAIFAFLRPAVPRFKTNLYLMQAAILGIFALLWLGWLFYRSPVPFSGFGMLFHGSVFFLLNALIHPLPSKFSLLRLEKAASARMPVKTGPFPPELRYVRDRVMEQEIQAWKNAGFHRELGAFHMPLIELPLFRAAGEALIDGKSERLLLLLKSEVRDRYHRCLLTFGEGKVLITTDFGVSEARFPERFCYKSLNHGVLPEEFLREHANSLDFSPTAVAVPPWEALDAMVVQVREFLNRSVSDSPASLQRIVETSAGK